MISRKDPSFIFVHIPKTGGTSIEATLSRLLLGKNLPDLTQEEARQYALPKRGMMLQHLKLFQYERRYKIASTNFFSFAVVRNPWDLVASEIRYFQKYERRTFCQPTFTENVRLLVNFKGNLWGHDFSPQATYLSSTRSPLDVSFIGRFERLQADFNLVLTRLGLPQSELPVIFNTSNGTPHYTELYDEQSKELVEAHFARDIEEFGYSFM